MSVATASARPLPGAIPTWTAEPSRGWLVGLMAWVLIALMIVPDNFDYANIANQAPAAGSLVSRTLWLALLVAGMLLVAPPGWLARPLLRSLKPFPLLLAALPLPSL